MTRSDKRPGLVARLAGTIVMVVGLAVGVVALTRETRIVFRDAPARVISAELEAQVKLIRGRVPPDATLYYLDDRRPLDIWRPRLWARALFPLWVVTPEMPQSSGGAPGQPRSAGRRYALAVGDPPRDPGFLWRLELPPLPGTRDAVWLGELPP